MTPMRSIQRPCGGSVESGPRPVSRPRKILATKVPPSASTKVAMLRAARRSWGHRARGRQVREEGDRGERRPGGGWRDKKGGIRGKERGRWDPRSCPPRPGRAWTYSSMSCIPVTSGAPSHTTSCCGRREEWIGMQETQNINAYIQLLYYQHHAITQLETIHENRGTYSRSAVGCGRCARVPTARQGIKVCPGIHAGVEGRRVRAPPSGPRGGR